MRTAHPQEVVIDTRPGTPRSGRGAVGPNGLTRPTSAHQVAEYIRQLIFDNRLRTGDRVPQDEIAADLRVSRVPVREAVIALDREGWVTSEPHRGAFVNGLDENSTRDHYALIGLMYGYAARSATERGTDEDIAVLEGVHRALQAATDADEFFDLNSAFLRQIFAMAQSRRMTAVARVFTTNIVPGNFFAEVPGVMAVQKRGLRVVMKAIKGRDGAKAQLELSATVAKQADNVVQLLKNRGLLTS